MRYQLSYRGLDRLVKNQLQTVGFVMTATFFAFITLIFPSKLHTFQQRKPKLNINNLQGRVKILKHFPTIIFKILRKKLVFLNKYFSGDNII